MNRPSVMPNRVILALVAWVSAVACIVTGPDGKGSRYHNPDTCASGRDANAQASGADLTVKTPSCYFTIHARAEQLSYQTYATLPVGSTGVYTPSVTVAITSSYDLYPIVWSQFTFMSRDGGNTQQWRGDLSTTGQPGYHTAPFDTTAMRDSISAKIDGLSSAYSPTYAEAYFVSVGNVAPGSHDLIGPTNPIPGDAVTYQMRTEWDTIGYTYSWALDGVPLAATGNQMVYTFGVLDGHVLRSIATTTSGTPDTVLTNVFVPFVARVNGPASIDSNGPGGTWTVDIPVGVAPYTY